MIRAAMVADEARSEISESPPSQCDRCGVASGEYNLCGIGDKLHCIYFKRNTFDR